MATLSELSAFRGTILSLTASTIGLMLAGGCQPANKPAAVAHLPAPTFDGPKIISKPRADAPLARSNPTPTGVSGPAAWTPHVAARPWRWIVIHHSASESGSMAVFDKEHRAKGWDGVGYHFVIGNGTNSADGQIEVTPRWPVQKWGAHAKTLDNRFNEYGIGICMVGNFDVERPTPAQVRSLTRLTAYLMQTYHIPAQNVLGHRDTKPTDCPGKFVNVGTIRSAAAQAIVDAGGKVEPDHTQTAAAELLGDSARYDFAGQDLKAVATSRRP
jgi:hypothetical protein